MGLFRYFKRFHVWVELNLTTGKTLPRRLMRPDGDGTIHYRGGAYLTSSTAFVLYKDRPLFRYMEGDPRPIRYTTKYAVSTNPGELVKVPPTAAHQVVPAKTLEILVKQHLFADAYANRGTLLLLLIAGMVVIFFAVVGLYLRK